MGDSGEGLVDTESKIQERMEELQRSREQARKPAVKNPELIRQLEALRLVRKQLAQQLQASTHEGRKNQLAAAIADLDQRIAEVDSRNK